MKRRGETIVSVFVGAAALLLFQAQLDVSGTADGGTEVAADAGSEAAAGDAATDGGTSEAQALRDQLEAQQAQVQLLEQQLAAQQESQQTMDQMRAELQGLQQQVADARYQDFARRQAEATQKANLNAAVEELKRVDQSIQLGTSSFDFSGLASMLPPEAASYVNAANAAMASGDYVTARYFVAEALNFARGIPSSAGPYGAR